MPFSLSKNTINRSIFSTPVTDEAWEGVYEENEDDEFWKEEYIREYIEKFPEEERKMRRQEWIRLREEYEDWRRRYEAWKQSLKNKGNRKGP